MYGEGIYILELCDCHDTLVIGPSIIHHHLYIIDRATSLQLSKEVGTLPALSSTSPRPSLSQLHSDLVVLVSRMGLELEALSRSVDATQQHSDSLAYHLLPSSNS